MREIWRERERVREHEREIEREGERENNKIERERVGMIWHAKKETIAFVMTT